MDWLSDLYASFFGASVKIAPEYLVLFVLIAYGVYRWQRPAAGFWAWLLPREIYTHRSTLLDLKLYVIQRLLHFSGLLARVSLMTYVAASVAGVVSWNIGPDLGPVWLALILFLMSDCILYWIHRVFHESPAIWPLHAVHHSAEVLTPLSAYRGHPVTILLITASHGILIGAGQGLVIGVLAPGMSVAEIAGLNVFIVAANLVVVNFHHSHIWISFGPVLERIVISPAQHQIHHSTNPAHYNRNYGQVLALWDWMFGTLYVIDGPEDVSFGLTEAAEAPLMTHRLGPVLWNPIKRVLRL